MDTNREQEKLSPQELKILKLVDDSQTRILQMEATIKRLHGQGPQLRYEPPDRKNDPESAYNNILHLSKAVDKMRADTFKKAFEIADELPSDKQRKVMQDAFRRLAPHLSEKDIENERRDRLTDRFMSGILPNISDDLRMYERESKEKDAFKSKFMTEEKQQTVEDKQPAVMASRFIQSLEHLREFDLEDPQPKQIKGPAKPDRPFEKDKD